MKSSSTYLLKLLYIFVALFLLAALVLQTLSSAGRLPATLPPGVPTIVSVAALMLALGVLLRRLWLIDRLLTRQHPQRATQIFPDHPVREVLQMQEAEQERSDRISLMSHELRTPITSINGFAELLMGDESVSGEAREFAEIIHTEAQRLSQMINTVLTEVQLAEDTATSENS
ncbi:MAG TPA: histidine kinase dimerization/phospho-acceptor domain-containing protein [Pyrinomonadaceae bacterium]|nr:histidine kinase dimerization/phospho-acceptor domain-containing protein [Pyrinomonadaceae bacterium]